MHRTRSLALKERKEAKKTATVPLCLLFLYIVKTAPSSRPFYEKIVSAAVTSHPTVEDCCMTANCSGAAERIIGHCPSQHDSD